MLKRVLLFAAVILLMGTAITGAPAVWRGPTQQLAGLDREIRDWVRALKNKMGSLCCDLGDGFPVEVDGWDMAGTVDDISGMTELDAGYARSGYRVRLGDGKWHEVPNYALIDPKNNGLVMWCGYARRRAFGLFNASSLGRGADRLEARAYPKKRTRAGRRCAERLVRGSIAGSQEVIAM